MDAQNDIQGCLVLGDNLPWLRGLPAEIADLVVTDPPFATGKARRSPHGAREPGLRAGRITHARFEDRWDDLEAYLAFLRPRLEQCHRILSPEGSLVLHLDHRAVHLARIELDRIFGRQRFINEIIWHYTGGGRARRYFSRKHDSLLWYARGRRWTFHIDEVRQPYKPSSGYARDGIVSQAGKRYQPHPDGTPADDVWDLPMINPLSRERTGYPTQKPEALLDRLIRALSRPGDLVCDPFCGSGTTPAVAHRLGRRWLACDTNPDAIQTTRQRLDGLGATPRSTEISGPWHPIRPRSPGENAAAGKRAGGGYLIRTQPPDRL
jgi:site-specific DNA-methyltransferase (adenine-specific)